MLLSGGIISSIALLLLAAIPIYLVAVTIMLFMGIGDSVRRSLNQALIMEIVEEKYRGRVISVYALIFGLMPLGVMPASMIAEFFGGRAASASLGIVLLIICLIILFTQKRIRELF